MKTEDCSKNNNDITYPESSENRMSRRQALNKAGLYALSATTMMVLLKSQPAKAQSFAMPAPNLPHDKTEEWQRTTRK